MVKNLLARAGDIKSGKEPPCRCRSHKRCQLIPGPGRSSGGHVIDTDRDTGVDTDAGGDIDTDVDRYIDIDTGFPGGGHGIPLHYSCLENPVDRGARWAP